MDEKILSVLTQIRKVMEDWKEQKRIGKTIFEVNWSQGGIGDIEITEKEKVK